MALHLVATFSAEASRREIGEEVCQAANGRQMGRMIRPDQLRDQGTLFHGWQPGVLLQLSQVKIRLLTDVVLLHNLHFCKLMLVDKCLSQHLVRDEGQSAIFTSMENFKATILHLLAKGDGAWVLRILPFIESYLERALTIDAA